MEDLDIRHFKLTNGDEIVGLVSNKNDTNWIIERPVQVNANLTGGYNFTPWFPFSDAKTFKVLKNHIVQHVPVADTVKSTYLTFALQLTNPDDRAAAIKSERESLEEYERELIDRYTDDDIDIKLTDKKTIH